MLTASINVNNVHKRLQINLDSGQLSLANIDPIILNTGTLEVNESFSKTLFIRR